MRTFAICCLSVLLWYAANTHCPAELTNPPRVIVPTPTQPHKPWRPRGDDVGAGSHVSGPEDGGKSVTCDLPKELHLRNKGGSDGAGLCVFTSIDMMSEWVDLHELMGFRDYMTKFPGGGYPEKVSQFVKRLSKERGRELVEGQDWGQFTDADGSKLDKILKTGRMVGVTYGYSPRYGQTIAHMVDLVMIDSDTAVILDNNFPGTYEWMSRAEFLRRWKMNHGGWGVWLNAPPPPPIPVN